MSVLIKGLKMPETCIDCPCNDGEYGLCNILGQTVCCDGRRSNCPLVELPDHGDLIEKDELMKHEVYIPFDGGNLPVVYMSYVKSAKTVISEERREECD